MLHGSNGGRIRGSKGFFRIKAAKKCCTGLYLILCTEVGNLYFVFNVSDFVYVVLHAVFSILCRMINKCPCFVFLS